MAALTPGYQEMFEDRSGRFFVITRVRISGGTDTVPLPEGLGSVNHVRALTNDYFDTAPTVSSISQLNHPQGATVTLTGGTPDALVFVMSMHFGAASGL